MQQRKLGHSPPAVSAIGLRRMGMSDSYGPRNDQESIQLIHGALHAGVNFLDTADTYGLGRNEVLVGKATKGRRNLIVPAMPDVDPVG